MAQSNHACCSESQGPESRPWYRRVLFLSFAGGVFFCLLTNVMPSGDIARAAFLGYLQLMWWAIALGLLLGGVLDHYIPAEYISKYLARKEKVTLVYAVGLGFLMSACSHGILAISMELHKKGASGPAVVSFLLASPWANLPVTFLLISFFGAKGFLIIVTALIIALITGLIFQLLDRKGWIEHNPHSVQVSDDFSIRRDLARRFRNYEPSVRKVASDVRGIGRGIFSLADMVIGWILIGAVLASLGHAYVPDLVFNRFLGPTALGLVLTLALAAVLEVCSEGTAPLAFELYRQTGAIGNSFAFLMGGVVTDFTEVGLVWTRLGKRTALWMLAVTLPQVILVGAVFNLFFR